MNLSETFKSVGEWISDNPELSGVMMTVAVMGLLSMGRGNSGLFNSAGNAAKAGGAGLLLTTALNIFNNREFNLQNYIPDFMESWLGLDEPG